MFAVPAENFGLSPPTSTKSLPAVLGASCPTSASSRTVDDRTLRGLQSRNHVDPAMDAEGGAEGNHVLRDIPQHAMSRILSSPRLSEIRGCHSQSRTFSSSAISFVSSGRKSVSMDSQFENDGKNVLTLMHHRGHRRHAEKTPKSLTTRRKFFDFAKSIFPRRSPMLGGSTVLPIPN